MKTNRFWLYGAAVVALLLAFAFWPRQPAVSSVPPQIEHPLAGAASVPASPRSVGTRDAAAPSSGSVGSSPAAQAAGGESSMLEQYRRYLDDLNVPIDFYGQVIDQNSNGVPGALVKAVARHWALPDTSAPPPEEGKYHFQPVTGVDGRFQISGDTADVIYIEGIEKRGYELAPATLRNYGPSSGSLGQPVIFKMWRRSEGQQLISHYIPRTAIPVDGEPVQFDLFSGKKVASGGQLIVRVERNPQILTAGYSTYDWRAVIEIPSGGLVASSDEFMYQAPDTGYQRAYMMQMPSNATNWVNTLNQRFYIECGGGRYYGNLVLDMPTFHSPPPIVLSLSVTLNPNGSRNLQP